MKQFIAITALIAALLVTSDASANDKDLTILGAIPILAVLVASAPVTPDDVLVEIYAYGSERRYCHPPNPPTRIILCIATIPSYWSELELVFRSLRYKTYRRLIPLLENATTFDVGTITLEPRPLDLALVDLVEEEPLTFDFKVRNIGKDVIYIKSVRFVFYPGSGVLSTCLPVWSTLYEFPLSAVFGGQKINIAPGTKLSSDYKLPDDIAKDRLHVTYVSKGGDHPYLMTSPLDVSQVVPVDGADHFKIRFVPDDTHQAYGPAKCEWHEVYEAHAVIQYNEDKELVTPRFQIGYYPGRGIQPRRAVPHSR